MSKCVLKISIKLDGENGASRVAEHVLRAQRMAWFFEGITNGGLPIPQKPPKPGKLAKYPKFKRNAFLDVENIGRKILSEHAKRLRKAKPELIDKQEEWQNKQKLKNNKLPAGKLKMVEDVSIAVSGIENGTQVVNLSIPVPSYFAAYCIRIFALETDKSAKLESELQTFTNTHSDFSVSNIQNSQHYKNTKKGLINDVKKQVGLFDSRLVDQMQIEYRGAVVST